MRVKHVLPLFAVIVGSLVFFDFVPMPRFLISSSSSGGAPVARPTATAAALGAAPLTAVSWNIAAINNNPFEYWVEIADPGYNELMANAQRFVDTPGAKDVRVDEVFTDAMFAELRAAMGAMQPAWTGVDEVAEIWATELSQRKIVSGFLKDRGRSGDEIGTLGEASPQTLKSFWHHPVYFISDYNYIQNIQGGVRMTLTSTPR